MDRTRATPWGWGGGAWRYTKKAKTKRNRTQGKGQLKRKKGGLFSRKQRACGKLTQLFLSQEKARFIISLLFLA